MYQPEAYEIVRARIFFYLLDDFQILDDFQNQSITKTSLKKIHTNFQKLKI